LSGPTNFGPVIREAVKIVQATKEYHVLVIVCDGQVTVESDTENAIVEASNYPLAIVIVGVGDGPWNEMENYDDRLPARTIDNVQFVDSSKFLSFNSKRILETDQATEARFALAAVQELPEHYTECRRRKMF